MLVGFDPANYRELKKNQNRRRFQQYDVVVYRFHKPICNRHRAI